MENEEEKPISEQLDFTKPDFSFTPKGNHLYRQQGYYLICRSCDLEHALFIGAHRILVGMSETGEPILKTRIELGMK